MDPYVQALILAQAQVMQVLLDTLGVDRRQFYQDLIERRFSEDNERAKLVNYMYDGYVDFLKPYDME